MTSLRSRTRPPPWIPGLLVLAALSGCGAGNRAEDAPRRGVVLIVIDTLRQDHLGCYGWHRDTTPSIDALAAESVRFERAYATAPWTQPSVASILTGLHPSRHGLTRIARLPAALDTLPERLRRHGFSTAAVVSHVLLARIYGFDQGFDDFKVAAALPAHVAISTDRVTDRASEALERFAGRDDPYFLFVHYFDPHYRYQRHPEAGFASERTGRLTGNEPIEALRELMETATDEELAFVRDVYDEEVRRTDAGVGRLIGRLRELDLYDQTLVVVTADHGEEFLDHGWLGHTRSLYEELVRVPLIVRPPGLQGPRVVEQPVSLASLVPTILDWAGIVEGAQAGDAESLAPLLQADARLAARPDAAVVVEVDFSSTDAANAIKNTHKKALIRGDLKLIRDDESGVLELYDLDSDPDERRNLATDRPAETESMRAELAERMRRIEKGRLATEEVAASRQQTEQLESLGYIERRAARPSD